MHWYSGASTDLLGAPCFLLQPSGFTHARGPSLAQREFWTCAAAGSRLVRDANISGAHVWPNNKRLGSVEGPTGPYIIHMVHL